jgi:hypothetical protein
MNVKKYKVWCDTDSQWEEVILDADAAVPTTCPTDPVGHTIDSNKTAIVETNVGTNVNVNNVGLTSADYLKVEVEPREGVGANYYTPNLCDRTTWYEGVTIVTEFALTDSGNQILWNTNTTHDGPWIDLTHGKLFAEDLITAATPTLLCKVEVSTDAGTTWVEKTENTFDDTDGDYSVDYAAGTISFNSALGGSDQVRASFSKAPATMTHTIKPGTGKRIRIVHVETQISKDVGITANVNYEVWAYNPNDLPNKMCIKKSIYKTLNDFLYESTGVYPIFPKMDISNPRGIPEDIIVVPFNYTATRDIVDSLGVEIRVVLSKPFTGTVCNSTFYCLEEDE